jgi:hypothetical protein
MHDYELENYLVPDDGYDYEVVFGKHDGTMLSKAVKYDPRYFDWVVTKNFPNVVHEIVYAALEVAGVY